MKHIENLILDMDGVLWRGESPLPGFVDFYATLRDLSIGFVMATNNASKTVAQYVEKFARLGVAIEPWQILSSAETTGETLAKAYPSGTSVYVVGDDGLREAFRSRGFVLLNDEIDGSSRAAWVKSMQTVSAELVAVGFTQKVTYPDFAAATLLINRGARFIGSNPDLTFPSEIGHLPGAGSLIAMVAAATGKTPTIMGKPYPAIFETALARLGSTTANTAMVGDRLETDIVGGADMGMSTILMLTGIATRESAASFTHPPTFICDGMPDLAQQLRASRESVA